MKTQSTKPIVAVIAALAIGSLNIDVAKAETTDDNSGLIYNSSAYIYPIQGAPNPAGDRKVKQPEIIYVNMAYGPATYSYPTTVAYQSTDFNVQLIDTAYGPAIYSYPSNKAHFHLNLVNNDKYRDSTFITPASLEKTIDRSNVAEATY
jgi:hypothetical protein